MTSQTNKLGLGCVTFGREIDESTSFELMDYAYAHEINLFDSAAVYGGGASEAIIGSWLKSRAISLDSVIISTKILPPYTSSGIRLSVETSLQRLGVEAIDVLYLHRWDELLNKEASWKQLAKLVREGKVKEIGVSNFNANQLKTAMEQERLLGEKLINYIQNNHNLAVSDITGDLARLCKEHLIKIVTFSPLGAGFLTGKHLQGVQPGSRFDVMPGHQDIYFNDQAQSRLRKLLQVAERTGHSATHLALAWAIHQPGVYKVLIGGRTIGHLKQAIEASLFTDPQLFNELESD